MKARRCCPELGATFVGDRLRYRLTYYSAGRYGAVLCSDTNMLCDDVSFSLLTTSQQGVLLVVESRLHNEFDVMCSI